MKRYNKIIISITLILVLGAISTGCSNSSKNPSTTINGQPAQISSDSTLKTFTLQELKKYGGQNGNPAYVAVNGKVYDVTNVPQWVNGKHHGYKAGVDLTEAIKAAPHGLSVLDNIPVVGKLSGN